MPKLRFVLNLLLEQTAYEKRLTLIGVAFLAVLFFMLVLDGINKNKLVPKSGSLVKFLIFLFIAAIIAVILLIYFYI